MNAITMSLAMASVSFSCHWNVAGCLWFAAALIHATAAVLTSWKRVSR